MDASHEEMVAIVTDYIYSLPYFRIFRAARHCYGHMGATITDGILQAGINYDAVVRPRVSRVLTLYPEAYTTLRFLSVLNDVGAAEVLSWRDGEKTTRVLMISRFFARKNVETEADLRAWLYDEENVRTFRKQRGIGPKTVDYFKMLVGIPTVAVDRHVTNFVMQAGIPDLGYESLRAIVCGAARRLGTDESSLDLSVWLYMSSRSRAPMV